MGREDQFHPTEVAVYFGEPGKTVADPYFGDEDGFEATWQEVDSAAEALVETLRP